MAQKLLLTKPNINFGTATSPDNFYLHSDYPMLKVHSTGNFAFHTDVGSVTITHNLGYRPFVLVYSQSGASGTTYKQHDFGYFPIDGPAIFGYTLVFSDRIVPSVINNLDAGTINGFYYIFAQDTV